MSPPLIDQYFNPGNYVAAENPVREKMLEEAATMADILVNNGNVTKVGIAGSLAKGKENPSDLDFIIFIDNETAKACHREKMKLLREGKNRKVQLSNYLKLNDEEWNWFAAVYSEIESQVDIQVISNDPDEEYIRMLTKDNIDPNFLENITDEVFLYDPSTGNFKKEEVYDEERRRMMAEASFERLKEILAGDDRYYETVDKTYSHQKRVKRVMGGQDVAEESHSKIEISGRGREVDGEEREKYLDLIQDINRDPFSDEIWDRVVELAKSEIEYDNGSGAYYVDDLTEDNFYDHVPLSALIGVGRRLREAGSREERYEILFERNAEGEFWYDIILGHVNDKMFEPVIKNLAMWYKFENGLDVGCGNGNSLKMLAPYCKECVGVDSSMRALEAARTNDLPVNVKLEEGNATMLPFRDKDFDIVTSNGLTYYLTTQEVREFVGEVDRVLQPGGIYMETVTKVKEGNILPAYEEEYLASAKAVLVCLLDRMCSSDEGIAKTESTVMVLVNQFKNLGYEIEFSGFNDDDLALLEFHKR